MQPNRRRLLVVFLVLLAGLPLRAALAQSSQDFGEHVVHFNALTTDMLPPEVAESYQVRRSENRGMLSVTVLEKVLGTVGRPVQASIRAHATNLNGQVKKLDVREVEDGNAIYYLSEFGVSDRETLNIELEVRPEGAPEPYVVRFRHQFFTR